MSIKSEESLKVDIYFFGILGFFLFLSCIFVFLHGEFIVSDGYIEYSKVIFYDIFNGPKPTEADYQIAVYAHGRPLFPLFVTITAYFFTFGNLGLAGHLISAICGTIGLIYFDKLLANRNLDQKRRKILILIMASSPAATVYWVKFAPEIMYLMFCCLSIFFYLKPRNKTVEKSTFYYLLFSFFALLTRESGVLLFLLPTFSWVTKIQDITKRIFFLIVSSSVLFMSVFISYILVLKPNFENVSWAYYFDTYVWIGYLSRGNTNLADIKLENIPEFSIIMIMRMISIEALGNLIGPFLVFGPILIIIITFYRWEEIFKQAIKEPVILWGVFYFAIIWFIMVSTFNERYTLILLLPILLAYSGVIENPREKIKGYHIKLDPSILTIFFNLFVLLSRFLIILLL